MIPGNAKLKNHIANAAVRIVTFCIPSEEKMKIPTDPFIAKSNKAKLGIQDEIK